LRREERMRKRYTDTGYSWQCGWGTQQEDGFGTTSATCVFGTCAFWSPPVGSLLQGCCSSGLYSGSSCTFATTCYDYFHYNFNSISNNGAQVCSFVDDAYCQSYTCKSYFPIS
jgi:hypothetical protein